MNLSKTITLDQLTKSEYGSRKNVKEQFAPPPEIIVKLTALCVNLLQPLKDKLTELYPGCLFRFTSGYRCPVVNTAAGGAESSQHLAGEASDNELVINGKEENAIIAKTLLDLGIDFDQMILEYGTMEHPDWIHLSWDLDKKKQRRMILRVDHDKDGNKRQYQITENVVRAIKTI